MFLFRLCMSFTNLINPTTLLYRFKLVCRVQSLDAPFYSQAIAVRRNDAPYFSEIEECYNLAPVIKSLRDNADLLNAFFIDNEK